MRIIRGKYGKRRFDIPKNITARPTTDFAKENLFNVLDNMIDFEGKTALDLFAGTGAISFEFLSRGCREVVAVEQAQVQVSFIKSIVAKLNDDHLKVIKGDVFKYIQTATASFDIIFADPPYNHERFEEVATMILNSRLIKPGTTIIIEHSGDRDFSRLPYFSQHRKYGSVNFSIFEILSEEPSSRDEEDEKGE